MENHPPIGKPAQIVRYFQDESDPLSSNQIDPLIPVISAVEKAALEVRVFGKSKFPHAVPHAPSSRRNKKPLTI